MLGLLDKYQELYRKQGGMTFLFGTGMTLSLWSDTGDFSFDGISNEAYYQ